MSMSRREFLAASSSLSIWNPGAAETSSDATLRVHAMRHNRLYGATATSANLMGDLMFATTLAREAQILVAEAETKRFRIEPEPKQFNFSGADAILRFAKANNQKMRGHTLVWHNSNPNWLETAVVDSKDEKLITDYIGTVVNHYRGQFHSWDVVNEAIEPLDGHPDGLRTNSIWFKAFGEDYIPTAFHAAREADPHALLFYNELNLEIDAPWADRRRKATLRLLERLRARNVPIDGFGMQGHLKKYMANYSEKVLSKFMDEVAAMGLKILVTEFDVADIRGPLDIGQRDREIADLTHMFLDVCFSKKEVLGCLTWGLTDKYSWLSWASTYKWPDGQLSRGLPFDASFNRKPMWNAMALSFDSNA